MNLEQAKEHLFNTHLAALDGGYRANAYALVSGPGMGKTDSIFQLAERLCIYLNEPVAVIIQTIADLTGPDLRGFMIPLRGEAGALPRSVFTTPSWMPANDNIHVVRPGPNNTTIWHHPQDGTYEGPIPEVGILFLDEWGQGDEDVRKAGAPLIHTGMVGTHALPRTWRVVTASNRPSDRSGVMRELMHIVGRRGLMNIEGDVQTWLNWRDDQPEAHRPHSLTRIFAIKHSGVVFRNTLPDGNDPYCSPRTLCMLDRDLRVMRSDEDIEHDRLPLTDLAREVAAGFIGQGAAGQYFAQIRFAHEIPDMDDILNDPAHAMVPTGMDAQMVVAYMLADQLDEKTAKPSFRYICRLDRRMQMLAVGTITGKSDVGLADAARSQAQVRRTKALVILPEYQRWLMDNKDTLLAAQM